MVEERDAFFMRKALRLAERGRATTSPNPMVGAVIVDSEGVIVGRGSHEVAGGPHAEVVALRDAGARAGGATLYCTLEPCSHHGRTGPCAPLVADSGIARVVVASQDPNPVVGGRGLALLRERGVRVECGVCETDAERLNAPFFTAMLRQRPYVTMKVALSLDGYIAARPGSRTAITGDAAARHVHRYRAEVDAIGIGSGTLLADDPLLTARGAYRPRPLVRVVFDRRLRTPVAARVLSTGDSGPVIIVTSSSACRTRRDHAACLTDQGAILEVLEDDATLRAALCALGRRGIRSVIVEGGASLHRALWDAGLVDRVQIYVGTGDLGSDGVPWIEDFIISSPRVTDRSAVPVGDDIFIEAYVHRAD